LKRENAPAPLPAILPIICRRKSLHIVPDRGEGGVEKMHYSEFNVKDMKCKN